MDHTTLLELGIAAAGFISSVAVVRSQVSDLRNEVRELEKRIRGFSETYVQMAYFRETVQLMRDDHRDLKEDVKKILAAVQAK